jgi:hypothetical protein
VSRELKRILAPQRDEITGGWRNLHERLHKVYSLNIIKIVKSGQGMQLVQKRSGYRVLVENPKGRGYSEVLDLDRKIILKLILDK